MINEYNNLSLARYNTFGIDVKASLFIEYDSDSELQSLIRSGRIISPSLHIGGGSNLLFTKDYEGTILHSRILGIEVTNETGEEVFLEVGAGVVWDDFVAYCVEHEWYGVENLSNIPGEVGASAVQNIGAYGVEAKDVITTVKLISSEGDKLSLSNEQCRFAYRRSIFKEVSMQGTFVTHVCFRLSKKPCYKLDYGSIREELQKYPEVTLAVVRRAIIDIRAAKLPEPEEIGNAGSFFMNPVVPAGKFEELYKQYPSMPFYKLDNDLVKIPAGWLIETCGWKGKSLGNAGVYEKQALVLVNRGGASGSELLALSDAVRASVREKFGIEIVPEVKIIS
ncbi:UDP-N-acetylmuramate dehydrogenase [Bacteroides sp. OttesenSCG-928-F21]|nr:UDP-N-acetylmuramate dehydrogenase [Bacteroides sp. OttesenSCG-928-F21]